MKRYDKPVSSILREPALGVRATDTYSVMTWRDKVNPRPAPRYADSKTCTSNLCGVVMTPAEIREMRNG